MQYMYILIKNYTKKLNIQQINVKATFVKQVYCHRFS